MTAIATQHGRKAMLGFFFSSSYHASTFAPLCS